MAGIHSFAGTSYGREPAPIIRLEAGGWRRTPRNSSGLDASGSWRLGALPQLPVLPEAPVDRQAVEDVGLGRAVFPDLLDRGELRGDAGLGKTFLLRLLRDPIDALEVGAGRRELGRDRRRRVPGASPNDGRFLLRDAVELGHPAERIGLPVGHRGAAPRHDQIRYERCLGLRREDPEVDTGRGGPLWR